MIVEITSPTGISSKALIDKDSGVIEYPDGKISHVLFEKQRGCEIYVVKPVKKEPVETEQAESLAPTEEVKAETTLKDKSSKRPKTKTKGK